MPKPFERSVISVVARRFRSRAVVELENLALRHQLRVLRRQRPGRLRLFTFDRLLWVMLYRLWPRCLEVMVLVKPATVIQWHRKGFRLFWRWRSKSGRPSADREIRDLIRQMSGTNPLWGAPRIHGELLKLGIEVSQATVAKYMVRRQGLAKLRTQWQLIILYNRHLTAELVRLMGLLKAAGVPAVTFKGPVLAAMAYGSIELRQFSDLDILVRQTDLPRVAEILTAERYLSPHTRREGLATGYFQECEDAFNAPPWMEVVLKSFSRIGAAGTVSQT